MHRDEAHSAGHGISEAAQQVCQHTIQSFGIERLPNYAEVDANLQREAEEGIIPTEGANDLGANENASSEDNRVQNEEEAHRSDEALLVRTHRDGGFGATR